MRNISQRHLAVEPKVSVIIPARNEEKHIAAVSSLLAQDYGNFEVNFMLAFKPWQAKDSNSKKFIGGGAFSLVRAAAYSASGTLQAIPMCVDDDLKLGKLIKTHGFRQEFVGGEKMISLEWYGSVKEMIHRLTKNSFAVLDYNVPKVAALFRHDCAVSLAGAGIVSHRRRDAMAQRACRSRHAAHLWRHGGFPEKRLSTLAPAVWAGRR